jgi:hypothetical protein
MCKDERKALNNKEQAGMFTVADKIELNKILRNLKKINQFSNGKYQTFAILID